MTDNLKMLHAAYALHEAMLPHWFISHYSHESKPGACWLFIPTADGKDYKRVKATAPDVPRAIIRAVDAALDIADDKADRAASEEFLAARAAGEVRTSLTLTPKTRTALLTHS